MKNLLALCFILLTCFAFAAEKNNDCDVSNFLGFSFRQPRIARYHMQEFMDYDAVKMKPAPGRIKMKMGNPRDIPLGKGDYFFYSFGFFAFGDCRDTYGLRFCWAETNDLAKDTGLNLSLWFSELKQMNGIQTAIGGGKVKTLYGLQLFPLYAITDDMLGAQIAGMTMLEHGKGFTAAVVAIAKEDYYGLHCTALLSTARRYNGIMLSGVLGGAFRMKGIQFSGFSSNAEEELYGAQISGFASIAKEVNGVQLGGYGNKTDTLNGAQIGCWNRTEDLNGFQIGIFNQARKSAKGVQFGLLNHMEGALVPWFPLFNIKL